MGGLIPAHAGKTRGVGEHDRERRAHPRSRGENALIAFATSSFVGSSPLTRGKRHEQVEKRVQNGLIPAHAGKTSQAVWISAGQGAHPRSRGENEHCFLHVPSQEGSSPLTRGKHFLTCAFIAQIGQILESLELCASSESYSSPDAYATDALQGRVRSIGLAPRSSRGAS